MNQIQYGQHRRRPRSELSRSLRGNLGQQRRKPQEHRQTPPKASVDTPGPPESRACQQRSSQPRCRRAQSLRNQRRLRGMAVTETRSSQRRSQFRRRCRQRCCFLTVRVAPRCVASNSYFSTGILSICLVLSSYVNLVDIEKCCRSRLFFAIVAVDTAEKSPNRS